MTARELLELAAKASGHAALGNMYGWDEIGPGMFMDANEPPTLWNPLADDGDALRLAVALSLRIIPGKYPGFGCHVEPQRHSSAGAVVFLEGQPMEQARRAIVIAAAEIGRAMP